LINVDGLSGAERDDAPDRVIRADAHSHAITGYDFDSEAAHPAAQLGEYLMSGIALHTVQPARVHGDHRSLHVDQIVFAQYPILAVGDGVLGDPVAGWLCPWRAGRAQASTQGATLASIMQAGRFIHSSPKIRDRRLETYMARTARSTVEAIDA
jgi:hypothetical protein